MKKKRFMCKKCGKKFEIKVFEEGEAEDKNLRAYPIKCPQCGGPVGECL